MKNMAKRYFLGTVGKAEAFRVDENGNLQLAFVSNTLTDSGLNISTTKDDIRAGQGAPIQFSFYHDPSVEITLTDVLWKPAYLEAQLGANFDNNVHEDYITETVEFIEGKATLEKAPRPLPIGCANSRYAIWGTPKGKEDWVMINYEDGKAVLTDATGAVLTDVTGYYCVRYLANDARANVAEITSQIIPQELYLIITAPIFAGDACAASKGEAAGHITFEVPRFQLNGSQEFSMNMSSNQTMSLSGIALASESADCDALGGKLLRIIEVIKNRDWKADITNLISDEEYEKVNKIPHIYGLKSNGSLVLLDNDELTFEPDLTTGENGGRFSAQGPQTIQLKKGTTVIAETAVTIAAAE